MDRYGKSGYWIGWGLQGHRGCGGLSADGWLVVGWQGARDRHRRGVILKRSTPTGRILKLADGLKDKDTPLSGWGTENPGYKVEEFYTGSTDGKGHNQNIQVPMPPNVLGEIASMVARLDIPQYRSPQDFMRDAAIHRLHQLAELDIVNSPDIIRAKDQAIRNSRVQNDRRLMEETKKTISDAEDNLVTAFNDGAISTMKSMLSQYEEMVDDLVEPWKSQLNDIVVRYRKGVRDLERRESGGK